jgi:hypothetical protein
MKPEWSRRDSLAATDEGWDVFAVFGSEQEGLYQLQRIDDPSNDLDYDDPVFQYDPDAWLWVYLNSASGLHRRAMEFLKAHSPEEYGRIIKHVVG